VSVPLRALLIEDNVHDADLIVRRLMREGFDVRWKRVDNERDFRAALTEEWDLLLCDYQLPQFGGLDALRIVGELGSTVPLLLVSGAIGEEIAVEAMRLGADDYLLKDRLERLGQAVRRALEQGRLRKDHARAQAALELSETRFRQLTDHIEGVFWILDPASLRVQYVSPAFERIWGHAKAAAEQSPERWPIALHPDDRERVQAAIDPKKFGDGYELDYRIARPDGGTRVIHDRGFAVRSSSGALEGIVGVADDVTRAHLLEEQFRQAQKMEGIGRLAGGIAHDFNNMLSVILSSTSMILTEGEVPPGVRRGLEEIQLAVERAAALTRQLLVFSRRDAMQPRDVDLNTIVGNMGKLLERLLGEDIELRLRLWRAPLVLRADASMLEQVIMNLAVNARDAMPRGGRLELETRAIAASALPDSLLRRSDGEQFCVLRVADSGSGIPVELQAKVFEPFFTTKPEGKGTGLGLATVYGIVQRHSGVLELQSEPGAGTTFSIYLPCTVGEAEAPRARPIAAAHEQSRGEVVLMVEDDPALRGLTRSMLESYGYRALVAADGVEALQLWFERRAEIDLLLTDMVMPGALTGRELARRLMSERPALKVVYMSGYSSEIAGRELMGNERFLAKPFVPSALAAVVRDCLDS
jgi:two-component system, cell cycle sensor histidine kinase and response regulator CckA